MFLREIFLILTPETVLSWVSVSYRQDIGHWSFVNWSFSSQIGVLFYQGQFPYCSGYEVRRLHAIF